MRVKHVTRVGPEALVLESSELADPFTALFRRVGPHAFRLALAITGDAAAAEDVVQEAFVRVFSRPERPDDAEGRALDAYLRRTARNLALDHLRRRKVVDDGARAAAAALLRPGVPDPGDGLDAAAVSRALFDLPVEQREVVALRVWEGLSFPEIAARTDAPLGTVHSRYRYALERLRATFARPERTL